MTESEWRAVDQSLMERIGALDDHELVRLLWSGDDSAWRYIYARSVVPMITRPLLRQILIDRHRDDLDVCAAVMNYLLGERKLAAFDFRCPVIYWIRYWVFKDILRYCKKNDNPLSDAGLNESTLMVQELDVRWLLKDEIAWCMQQLWSRDRTKALVLQLRAIEGLTAAETMMKLGLSSVDNVNQLYSRAIKMMKEIRVESCCQQKS